MIYFDGVRKGHELAAHDAIAEVTASLWKGRQLIVKSRGKDRRFKWHDAPALPGYVVFECLSPHQYYQIYQTDLKRGTVSKIQGLYCHPQPVPASAVAGLRDFVYEADAAFAQAKRRAHNQIAPCPYNPGERLEILAGPFAGLLVRFEKTIERHGDIPRIEVETDILGAKRMQIDPLEVKAVDR